MQVILLVFITLLSGWSTCSAYEVKEAAAQFQKQSANTRNGLENYQLCYDISRRWWKLHQPELALDFLFTAAREADLILPPKLSATKLLDLAELATREYRDRYTAEEMIQHARERMRFILDYYEWRVPYQEANRIEKEAEQLQYLPRGKYIPRPVTLPVRSTAGMLQIDLKDNAPPEQPGWIMSEPIKPDRPLFNPPDESKSKPELNKPKPPSPEPKKPKEPLPKPSDKPKEPPPVDPDKDKPPLPPKPPRPPDKPDKPPGDRPKPPLPPEPPSSDTAKPQKR